MSIILVMYSKSFLFSGPLLRDWLEKYRPPCFIYKQCDLVCPSPNGIVRRPNNPPFYVLKELQKHYWCTKRAYVFSAPLRIYLTGWLMPFTPVSSKRPYMFYQVVGVLYQVPLFYNQETFVIYTCRA